MNGQPCLDHIRSIRHKVLDAPAQTTGGTPR